MGQGSPTRGGWGPHWIRQERGRAASGFPVGGGGLGSRRARTHVQDNSSAPAQRGGAGTGAGVHGGGGGDVGGQRRPGLPHSGAYPAQQPAQRPALRRRLPEQPVRAGPAQARRPLAHRAAPATATAARKPADPRPSAPARPLPGAAARAAPPSLPLPPRPRPRRRRAGAGGPVAGEGGCAPPGPRATCPVSTAPLPRPLPRLRAAAGGCPRGRRFGV